MAGRAVEAGWVTGFTVLALAGVLFGGAMVAGTVQSYGCRTACSPSRLVATSALLLYGASLVASLCLPLVVVGITARRRRRRLGATSGRIEAARQLLVEGRVGEPAFDGFVAVVRPVALGVDPRLGRRAGAGLLAGIGLLVTLGGLGPLIVATPLLGVAEGADAVLARVMVGASVPVLAVGLVVLGVGVLALAATGQSISRLEHECEVAADELARAASRGLSASVKPARAGRRLVAAE